jgi:hypothetical protein
MHAGPAASTKRGAPCVPRPRYKVGKASPRADPGAAVARRRPRELLAKRRAGRHGDESPAIRLTRYFCIADWISQRPRWASSWWSSEAPATAVWTDSSDERSAAASFDPI